MMKPPLTIRQTLILIPLITILILIGPPLFIPQLRFEHWLHLLTGSLVLGCLPGVLVTPVVYARTRWEVTHLGRAVMSMALSIAGIVLLGALRVFSDWPMIWETYSGDPVPVDLFRVLLYGFICMSIYYYLLALWAVSRRGRDLHSDDAEIRSHL